MLLGIDIACPNYKWIERKESILFSPSLLEFDHFVICMVIMTVGICHILILPAPSPRCEF
jgi:hypothetical protein